MASQPLDPIANFGVPACTLAGAATEWQALADSSDSSYIELASGVGGQSCSVKLTEIADPNTDEGWTGTIRLAVPGLWSSGFLTYTLGYDFVGVLGVAGREISTFDLAAIASPTTIPITFLASEIDDIASDKFDELYFSVSIQENDEPGESVRIYKVGVAAPPAVVLARAQSKMGLKMGLSLS